MLNHRSKQTLLLLPWRPDTDMRRTAQGLGAAFRPVCSCASPSPAVGLLCDGACRKGIGGTFHTLGAAWWGAGSSLMNRVHLAGWKGLPASPAETWFADQSGVIPVSSSHTLLLVCLPILGVLQLSCNARSVKHTSSSLPYAWTTCFPWCPQWTLKPWLLDFPSH